MNTINKTQNIIILAVFSLVLSAILSSCIFSLRGKGDVVTEVIDLSEITGVELAIEADITLIQGDKQNVEIRAQKNIIDNIKRKVRSGTWEIEFEKKANNFDPINITITLPEIKIISIPGSGEVFTDDVFETNLLELDIAGSGIIDILMNCEKTDISIPGSGDIYLIGTAAEQDISISGSGSYFGHSFESENCDINISGSGDCEVFVSDNLFVKISGSGSIYYRGTPNIVHQITGSGRIINDN